MSDTMTDVPVEPSDLVDQFEGQVDYFGVDSTETVFLPDGKSYVVIKELTEGDRRKYLNAIQRDIRLERQTGDAHLRMATGDERYHLLKAAIVDWNLVQVRNGKKIPLPFNDANLNKFLEKTSPRVLDPVEEKVRDMNEWLVPTDMTIEAIDEEIERLQEMKTKIEEREAGNDS